MMSKLLSLFILFTLSYSVEVVNSFYVYATTNVNGELDVLVHLQEISYSELTIPMKFLILEKNMTLKLYRLIKKSYK